MTSAMTINGVNLPARRHRMPITEERKQLFLDTLARTGSIRAAALAASPHLIENAKPDRYERYARAGEESFRQLRLRDPIFAEQWDAAESEAVGRAEETLVDRMRTPDTRPVLDRQGNIIGQDISWRSANVLLLRFLERADDKWIQKRQIEGNQTITVNQGMKATERTGVLLCADDVKRLPPERMALLLTLVEEVYQLADQAKADSSATQPALPGPGVTNG